MKHQRNLLIGMVAACLVGCGSMPDVRLSYYFPKAETQLAVTQTLGCSPKIKNKHRELRSVITVVPSTVNSADLDWLDKNNEIRRGHLHYKDLHSWFSDADATVTLTSDGRLSGINTTGAGEGLAIVQNAATAIGAVLALAPLTTSAQFVENDVDKACGQVDHFAALAAATSSADDKDKASIITLTYSVAFTYQIPDEEQKTGAVSASPVTGPAPKLVVNRAATPDAGYDSQPVDSLVIQPDFVSSRPYKALAGILDKKMQTSVAISPTLVYLDAPKSFVSGKDAVLVDLTKVARVSLVVKGYVGDLSRETQIWQGAVPVPTHQVYQLPIPKPQVFGKTAFGLGLSDYGAVTSLHYGSNSGQPDVLSALGAVAKALQPKSAADKAAEYQGKADLIAQQQRLVNCQLSPTTCE